MEEPIDKIDYRTIGLRERFWRHIDEDYQTERRRDARLSKSAHLERIVEVGLDALEAAAVPKSQLNDG